MKTTFKNTYRKMRGFTLAALFAFLAMALQAQNTAAMEVSDKRHGFVTEEIKYPYSVEVYSKSLPINRLMLKGQIKFSNAEQVAARHVAAMLSADYQTWISLWEEQERKQVMAKHSIEGKNEAFWLDLWAKTFSEYDQFNFTRRVESRNFVIIEMVATATDGTAFTVDIPLVKISKMGVSHYYITDTMKGDPVYENWRLFGAKVQKEAR